MATYTIAIITLQELECISNHSSKNQYLNLHFSARI